MLIGLESAYVKILSGEYQPSQQEVRGTLIAVTILRIVMLGMLISALLV